MSLRLMQIFVPQDSGAAAPDELLEGREVLGRWRDDDGDQLVLNLLVPAEETEPIMDQFEQHYADVKGFHVVLFPVEAVLPRPHVEEVVPEETLETKNEPVNSGLRISREELYNEVNEGLGITRVFVGMTVLSAVVAAVGLMRDDVAVIIGAMVIAPLLGPNVALSLGTTLGDTDLVRRSLFTSVVGVVTTFVLAFLVGAVFPVDVTISSIESRTSLNVTDVILAMAAGIAGTLAFTRGLSGAVIGVMVAVALVPPLVVSGLLMGAGDFSSAVGALLLTSANLICVNLAGIVTFLIQGVRPRSWWDAERAHAATIRAVLFWSVLLLLLLLVLWLGNGLNWLHRL